MAYAKLFEKVKAISIALLLIHAYLVCYSAFNCWGLSSPFTDRLFGNLGRNPLFADFHRPRIFALLLLLVSAVLGGNRDGKALGLAAPAGFGITGLALFFAAPLCFFLESTPSSIAISYLGTTILGYGLTGHAAVLVGRRLHRRERPDIFNAENQTFPQEQRRLADAYSINLATRFHEGGRIHKGWINIDAFRGLLVMGSSGSAKTSRVIRPIIRQHLSKGFAMLVFDFKYDDLTRLTWHYYRQYRRNYPVRPKFYVINFEDLSRSHRCNPISPFVIRDLTDATEAATTILLGLNPEWVEKTGDFWVESSKSFLTALIWYLRKKADGRYCTLPHVIELLMTNYDELFSILRAEPDISAHINPFLSAYLHGVKETLDNQLSTLKITLTRLSSPAMYYVLTGNDLTLDLNDPHAPKVLCLGSHPRASATYGAVCSLYITAVHRLINRKGGCPCSLIYDEMATVRIHQLHELLATGRSNKVAVTMCVQDASQMRLHYGRTQAEVILNLPGSIISGQVGGDSARMVSEKIGKIVQQRQSVHHPPEGRETGTSVTEATQLDYAVPVSRIATLSTGEFAGVVADNPGRVTGQKAFHGEIVPEPGAFGVRPEDLPALPPVREVTQAQVEAQFAVVKTEVKGLVSDRLTEMMNSPALAEMILGRVEEREGGSRAPKKAVSKAPKVRAVKNERSIGKRN